MSSIQLSEELLIDVQKLLTQHDEAAKDMGVAVQYMSAMTGLLLANFKSYDTDEKKELLSKLYNFAEHVMTDNIAEEQKQASQGTNDEAFGVWKP